MRVAVLSAMVLGALAAGCSQSNGATDASSIDAEAADAAEVDAYAPDVTISDASARDAGLADAQAPDAGALGVDAGAGMCRPSWHPTACGDCSGGSSGGACTHGCDPISFGDGHHYFARCDDATHTCHCFVDMVEMCSCTFSPATVLICEPVELGGSNCCWNVG